MLQDLELGNWHVELLTHFGVLHCGCEHFVHHANGFRRYGDNGVVQYCLNHSRGIVAVAQKFGGDVGKGQVTGTGTIVSRVVMCCYALGVGVYQIQGNIAVVVM